MFIFSGPFNKNKGNEHIKGDEMNLFIFGVELCIVFDIFDL